LATRVLISDTNTKRVLKKIASFGMATVLMATLLWGGCLSCAQYFMFPSMGAKACCTPSGECKDRPSRPSSQEECRIQPLALAQAPTTPERGSTLSSFAALPALATKSTVALRLGVWDKAFPANLTSPPDLCLLHSVLRI
jgi:hypothetical protein